MTLNLHAYLARKAREMRDVQRLLDRFVPASVLNCRQLALIVVMRKHPDMFYTIESHRRSHNVSCQTPLVRTSSSFRTFVW